MPFDLDDMAEILMADDGSYTPHENGPFGFGRFDIGQLRRGPLNTRLATSSDSLCAASRRSNDPGVLEVSSVILPLPYFRVTDPIVQQDSNSIIACQKQIGSEPRPCDVTPPGEVSLQCYEFFSANKRRKIAAIRSCTKHRWVSVKVNGSSSRSTIFSDLQMDNNSRYGRLLEATLPAEVQSGRIMTAAKALKIAQNLGSYDSRHGLSTLSSTGKSANRLSCGRTRLIWTEKSPSDQPQKVFFSSLLTGVRLEGAGQKRPRDIKLAIRVGGEIFGSHSSSEETAVHKALFFENFPVATRSKLLIDAVDHPNAQCMMDDEQFVNNVLNDASRSGSDRGKARGRSVSLQPVLHCLPDSNGLIGVVCTFPGKISISSVHECFNRAAKEPPLRLCTVCWAPDVDQDNLVKVCSDCGVLVHLSCCYDKGETRTSTSIVDNEEERTWRCSVCCHQSQSESNLGSKGPSIPGIEQAKKSKRKSRLPQWLQDSHIDESLATGRLGSGVGDLKSPKIKCALCPYQGGAMSCIPIGSDHVWMHEVCRTWLKGRIRTMPSPFAETECRECALCGQGKRQYSEKASADDFLSGISEYLVKCAASRCQVYFHPMCGLLSSKLYGLSNKPKTAKSEVQTNDADSRAESPQDADKRLCSCFTLTALKCEVTTCSNGKDPGTRQVVELPIVFCGIHNPKREASFRGLYPAGRYVNSEVMRVPAVR